MSETESSDLERVVNFLNSDEDSWGDYKEQTQVDNFQRYEKKEFLAAGGMKEIYKVYDSKTRRKLAMAQLKKDGPLWHCESFLKEAYLTASLEHPNIISVYDVGISSEDEPYFLMELKVGLTLDEIARKSTDKNELLQIFSKVCDAVSYAHSLGVLHLDIKPDNIQVGRHGEVKLCDWGLACKVTESEQDSVYIKGTPGFMSPEQVSKGRLTCQTDIYSLGALLYFLLTDSAPFEGGMETKMISTSEGKFVSPIEKFPDLEISKSLDAVVKRAMSTEPDKRYKSVDELKSDLTNYLTGHSTKAENAGFVKECLLFYKRNRQSCIVSIVFLLILSITVSFFVRDLNKSNKQLAETLDDLKITFQKSEENHEKFIEQRDEQLRANYKLKVKSLEDAFAAVLYPVYFFDPLEAIENSMKILLEHHSENEDSDVEQQIIKNLFISQEFNAMAKYRATYTKPLVELAQNYIDDSKKEKGTLSLSRFVDLMKDLNELDGEEDLRDSVMERMVYYRLAKRRESFVNYRILIELLRSKNPDWNPHDFTYTKTLKKAVATGDGLQIISGNREYHSKKSFFTLLNLDELVLKNSGISKGYQFSGLNLQVLDIRETGVKSLNPHSAFRGISTLHISEGQFDGNPYKIPPSFLEIVIDK